MDVDHHDKAAIGEVLVRYATAIDSRDWRLFATCFTEDCEADYGPIGSWSDAPAITAWMEASHAAAGPTMHRITNQSVTTEQGDVLARSYVDALVLAPDAMSGTRAVGFYDDKMLKTSAGWRIARRSFTMVLLQLVPDGTIIDLGGLMDETVARSEEAP
jgi:3-phenylpropionate/cinnamic acid dioxygenase small subunit